MADWPADLVDPDGTDRPPLSGGRAVHVRTTRRRPAARVGSRHESDPDGGSTSPRRSSCTRRSRSSTTSVPTAGSSCRSLPGMNPENMVGYFKRPVGAPDGRRRGPARGARAVACPRWPSRWRPTSRPCGPGSYVFTSGQLPMRSGQLMATGKVGGEVTRPRTPRACAQQCALNAIAAVKAEIGDLDRVKRVVKVVCFVASTPDFTGQPAGRQRRVRAAGHGVRRRGCARALGGRRAGAAAGRARRGRDHRRGLTCGVSPAAAAGGARPGVRRRRADAGRAARRRDRGPAAAPAARGPRSTCCVRQTSMAFAGGMCVFPGGGVDPRDFDHVGRLGRARPGELGGAAGDDGGDGAGAGVRRGARDVRGVGGAAGRRVRRRCRRRHHGRRLGGRPAGARGQGAVASPSSSTGAGWCCAPTCSASGPAWCTPEFEPRRFRTWFFVADPAGGSADPRRVDRVVVGDLAAGAGGLRRGRRRRARDDAADLPHLPRGRASTPTPADVLAAARERVVEMFTPAWSRGGRRRHARRRPGGSARCSRPGTRS